MYAAPKIPLLVIRHLIAAAMILILTVNERAAANGLTIYSFGGNNATTSTEILLLIEDVVRAKSDQFKIISIKENIGYRNNSDYIIPTDPDAEIVPFSTEKAFDVEELNQKIKRMGPYSRRHEVFESARAMLVIPPEVPPEFFEALKNRKNTVSKLSSNTRFWNDLQNYQISSAINQEGTVEKYKFGKKSWVGDSSWKLIVYKDYLIQFGNKFFEVQIIPKAFGGLHRILGAAAQNAEPDSVIVSTGNLLTDDEGRYVLLTEFFNKFQNAFVVANSEELANYGAKYTPPEVKELLGNRVLSYNLCETTEKECVKIFKPYKSINSGGFKIAVVGITSPELQNELDKMATTHPKLKTVKIQSPSGEEFSSFILSLRKSHDLVVLATNMSPSYLGEKMGDVTGVDFIIHRDNRRFAWDESSESVFKNYSERFPLFALQKLDVGSTFGHKIRIEKKKSDLIIKSRIILLDQTKSSGKPVNDIYDKILINNFFKTEYVLPDHKELFPEKIIADREEFAKFSAQVMKSAFNAEAGIFNQQGQGTTVVGPQDERGVRTWIRQDDFVEIVYVKGSELKRLYQMNDALKEEDKLAIFGVTPDSKIDGLSISGNEYYRVVLPRTVAQARQYSIEAALHADKFTKLNDGTYQDDERGQPLGLADFLISNFKTRWKDYTSIANNQFRKTELLNDYKNLYKGEPITPVIGYWTHRLDNLTLEYSQLTTTDASAFSSVTDSRLKTVDQRYFAASLNYKANYNRAPFVDELGISARYAKQEIFPAGSPSVITILDDQIRIYVNAALPIYNLESYPWLGKEMGPYTEISYETEFDAEPGLALQKNLTGFIGWKVLNGEFVKNASVFALLNKYLTETHPRTVTGAGTKVEASKKFLNDVAEYKLSTEYRYFFDDDDPVADIRSRFVFDQSFNLNITNKISFGPYFRYFSMSRKSVDETVSQNIIGVNLTYSDFWKPKYRTP